MSQLLFLAQIFLQVIDFGCGRDRVLDQRYSLQAVVVEFRKLKLGTLVGLLGILVPKSYVLVIWPLDGL